MTDEDVIRRAHHLAGVGRVYARGRAEPHHKDQWIWIVSKQADVALLLDRLTPHFGIRRRQRAEEALRDIRRTDRKSHRLSEEQKAAVIEDWRATGASQRALAARHPMSRSRVQQLLAAARKDAA